MIATSAKVCEVEGMQVDLEIKQLLVCSLSFDGLLFLVFRIRKTEHSDGGIETISCCSTQTVISQASPKMPVLL